MKKRTTINTPSKDAIGIIVEAVASERNLLFEAVTNVPGKRAWKITAGTQIASEIAVWGDDDEMTCIATPILFRDGYAVYLPSDLRIESDVTEVSEWVTQAIVTSLERADALLEILNSLKDAVRSTGYRGKLKETAPTQKKNDISFHFIVAESVGGNVFATELVIGVHESCFSTKSRMRALGKNGGMPLFERELVKSKDPARVLESIVFAIEGSREAYDAINETPQTSEAYQRLLKDPQAYGDRVVIMVPRPKVPHNAQRDK